MTSLQPDRNARKVLDYATAFGQLTVAEKALCALREDHPITTVATPEQLAQIDTVLDLLHELGTTALYKAENRVRLYNETPIPQDELTEFLDFRFETGNWIAESQEDFHAVQEEVRNIREVLNSDEVRKTYPLAILDVDISWELPDDGRAEKYSNLRHLFKDWRAGVFQSSPK